MISFDDYLAQYLVASVGTEKLSMFVYALNYFLAFGDVSGSLL